MLGQRGDTIVEVVIAIAVASAALIGAYASTNKNSLSTQTAQERTQAVKLVETQVEYLRAASGISAPNNCFVIDSGSGTPGKAVVGLGSLGGNLCIVTGDGVKATALDQLVYRLSVSLDGSTNSYKVSAVWDNIAGTGTNNAVMYYRPVAP
jgi:hypothetical protein